MELKRCFFAFLLALSVGKVSAFDLQIRAVFPNPVGIDTSEWVAIENTSAATISAGLYLLRDTTGSTKTASLSAFRPYEVKTITATQSGITLNNSGESVELLYGSSVIDSTANFIATQEGTVFLKLNESWVEVSLNEYQERLATKNWLVIREEAREVVFDNDFENEVEGGMEVSLVPSHMEKSRAVNRKLPRLFLAQSSATPSAGMLWPVPPEPHYDQEMALFLDWKKRAIIGSLSLIFGGTSLLFVSAPPLLKMWRWLREEVFL